MIAAAQEADKQRLEQSKHELDGAKLGVDIAQKKAEMQHDTRKHIDTHMVDMHNQAQDRAHEARQHQTDQTNDLRKHASSLHTEIHQHETGLEHEKEMQEADLESKEKTG